MDVASAMPRRPRHGIPAGAAAMTCGVALTERDLDYNHRVHNWWSFISCRTGTNTSAMGLLTIIRKNRQKEKEMRILFL